MKKFLYCILFIFSLFMLASCQNNSSIAFKGESGNWICELIADSNFWGKETQRIIITYKGENLEKLGNFNFDVESSDFLGWGVHDVVFDNNGIYESGDVIKLARKTPNTSTILVNVEGELSETITLRSSS
ncbi:hypothetical protein QT711_00095 [Sporosarcina saromensis]|uniref:Lipoprotein n=1 Tax=Sporosarcina saromensis TaxID=359365 RepID=A0ABU4G7G9_9BACL|nr:hypothetical protein [Sporosarcina saromensis]MDW0111562.1 hypothetical protein [Sporosarcina saromensis]